MPSPPSPPYSDLSRGAPFTDLRMVFLRSPPSCAPQEFKIRPHVAPLLSAAEHQEGSPHRIVAEHTARRSGSMTSGGPPAVLHSLQNSFLAVIFARLQDGLGVIGVCRCRGGTGATRRGWLLQMAAEVLYYLGGAKGTCDGLVHEASPPRGSWDRWRLGDSGRATPRPVGGQRVPETGVARKAR